MAKKYCLHASLQYVKLKLGRKFTAGLAEGKLVFNLKRKKKKATIADGLERFEESSFFHSYQANIRFKIGWPENKILLKWFQQL